MKLKTALLAAASVALLSAQSAIAALTFTLEEVGTDVVLTGSGTANLTELAFYSDETGEGGGVYPSFGIFLSSSGDIDLYEILSFIDFGSGPGAETINTLGPPIGVIALEGPPYLLAVPDGYVSGEPIATSTSTFANTDLATLGVTPGTYTWTWGRGTNADSATLTAVPEPSTYATLAGVLFIGLAVWRRQRKA